VFSPVQLRSHKGQGARIKHLVRNLSGGQKGCCSDWNIESRIPRSGAGASAAGGQRVENIL
jgi:hypothetical protein